MAGFPPAMVSGEPCLLVQTQFPHLYSEGSSPTTPIFLQRKMMSVIGWGLWPLLVQALLVSSLRALSHIIQAKPEELYLFFLI